ncbi:MAG: ASKHA domain-containing protein [Geminicoccaceae bacterium]
MTDALVVFTPSGKRGRFPLGTPVLTAARQLGVDLDSVCGGRAICGRCQVEVGEGSFAKHGLESSPSHLQPLTATEARYRERKGLAPARRLGCQATLLGDVVIDVPPESQVHRPIVRKRAEARAIDLDPATRLYLVEVEPPDMHRQRGDLERLGDALERQWGLKDLAIDLAALQSLQRCLRAGDWQVTVAVHQGAIHQGRRILALWPGYRDAVHGLAVDVGSTTIAAHLCHLLTGEVLASAGAMNPQIRFGEDLMSRVSYAMMNPGGAEEMTAAVRDALDGLARSLCAEAGIEPSTLLELVVVGNPVMHHLVLGLDPTELGGAPFALATDAALELPARELGLTAVAPAARLYLLPCIAGHVGADCAAVMLSESPHLGDAVTLLVDVGTNAEIVLGNRGRLLACSSPTGPAFEGAQIGNGQRAAPGAIERVRIDPATLEPRLRVIGSDAWSDEPGFATAPPVTGICGSGIIEVLAEMYLAGILLADGTIDGSLAARSPRIRPDGRTFAYVLREATPEILIRQTDVRAIQLAKAALYAGARLLMDRLEVASVDRIVLAGAFGSHIDPVHAMVLGMIPDCPVAQVGSAGNAAGTGARIALLNQAARAEIEALVRRVEKVETAIEPRFQEHFVAAMAIPHRTDAYPHLAQAVTLPERKPAEAAGGERRRRRGGR